MALLMALWVFLLCVSCARHENRVQLSYQFDTHATLAIKNIGDKSPHTVHGTYYTFLPPEMKYTDTLTINTADEYYLKFQLTKPGKVYLAIDDTLSKTLFLIPDDTVYLKLDLSSPEQISNSMRFEGQYANINYFMLKKIEHFDENTLNFERAHLQASEISLSEYAVKMDSLNDVELRFLEDYLKAHNVPQWFVEHEKAEIIYATALSKNNAPIYREKMLGRKEEIPEKYFDFVNDILFSNPNAIFSPFYYLFLDSYFYRKIATDELEAMERDERIKIFAHTGQTLADSLLEGEIKEIYKCHNISHLAISQGKIFLADDLMQSNVNKFHHKKYSEYLENYRNIKFVLNQGEQAPDFYLSNAKDEYLSMKDFQGKVILLNFWFPGCAPCIKEIPYEKKLTQMFSVKEFVMLNICTNTSQESWLKALDRYKMEGTNLFAVKNWQKTLERNYAISGYPHYALVDKNGKIYQNNSRRPSAGVEEDIGKLLDE